MSTVVTGQFVCPLCIEYVQKLEEEVKRLRSMLPYGPVSPLEKFQTSVGEPLLAKIRFQPRHSVLGRPDPVIHYDVVRRTRHGDWEQFRLGEIIQVAPIRFPPDPEHG